MILERLKIYNGIEDKEIRNIKFNRYGLSLIVDRDSRLGGSNIGKTTAVKIIDLCLGGKSIKEIYYDKDTGNNEEVKSFLENNKVFATLTVSVKGIKYDLKRDLFGRGKIYINEMFYKIKDFRVFMRKIVFNIEEDLERPRFRELITKFVRLDTSETMLLKYNGTYTRNEYYYILYEYLFGISNNRGRNIDLSSNILELKTQITAIEKRNNVNNFEEIKSKIMLLNEEINIQVKELKKAEVYKEYKDIENIILAKKEELEADESRLDLLKSQLRTLKTRKYNEEKDEIQVDISTLETLYTETVSLGIKIKEFSEFVEFHNQMIANRKKLLNDAIENLDEKVKTQIEIVAKSRENYEKIYTSFSSEVRVRVETLNQDYYSSKEMLARLKSDYDYIDTLLQRIEKESNQLVVNSDELSDKRIARVNDFNSIFTPYTRKVLKNSSLLNFYDDDSQFPISITGITGKLGAGTKKAMMTCFDLALIQLAIDKDISIPHFEIHDKMENIPIVDLKSIILLSRGFKGQYIFPILKDRTTQLNISNDEIVLELSEKDKLFKI